MHGEIENKYQIDHRCCWRIFKYPRVIDLSTEDKVAKLADIDVGSNSLDVIAHQLNFFVKSRINC